jgi:spore germination cell wall hydrolase CwlJ-like protein
MSALSAREASLLGVACALVAVLGAGMAGWHSGPAPHRSVQTKIMDDVPAIPRQYRALVDITEREAAPLTTGQEAEAQNDRLRFTQGAVAAASPFRALQSAGEDRSRALQCLTQAIYYEAAAEPESGQRAVAQVVLNRVRHPAFAKTVCGVVYQRFNASVCQFSFVCDGSLARRPVAMLWNRAQRIAAAALAGEVEPSVGTATHYHADYVFPGWAPHLAKLAKIGAHIFYRWPGTWGLPRAFVGRYAGGEYIPAFNPAQTAAVSEPEIDYPPIAALPERRAANDVGGRMDPTKGWKLSIPDPSQGGGALSTMLAAQEKAKAVALAADEHAMQEAKP